MDLLQIMKVKDSFSDVSTYPIWFLRNVINSKICRDTGAPNILLWSDIVVVLDNFTKFSWDLW